LPCRRITDHQTKSRIPSENVIGVIFIAAMQGDKGFSRTLEKQACLVLL